MQSVFFLFCTNVNKLFLMFMDLIVFAINEIIKFNA